MKKVGILNFQYSTHNYGAVLQAAALEHICREMGYETRHIDYVPGQRLTVRSWLGQTLRKLGLRRSVPRRPNGQQPFERFRKKFITRTRRVNSAHEFRNIAKSFDSIVVGSDQVWRPLYANDPIVFFLGHVPPGVDRVAYAASFGTTFWENELDVLFTKRVRAELVKFKAISCREDSGVEICKTIFGVEASHVLDPLLLVSPRFFDNVIKSASTKPKTKLVYYKLDTSEDFEDDLKAIASCLGVDATNAYYSDFEAGECREVADWLSLIVHTEILVTDSFHGICLGLRFDKEVFYSPNPSRGQARIDSLFKKLRVEAQPIGQNLKTQIFKLVWRGNIQSILEAEAISSLRFLKDALS